MMKRPIFVGVIVVAHIALQFVAWSVVPGNTATGRGAVLPWRLLSFPIFAMIPPPIGAEFFFYLLFINSAVFGLAVIATWRVIQWGGYFGLGRKP
jgi:hypothetical protein